MNTLASNCLISIVLPVYNGARFLDESIKSCLSQTYSSIELIVIDDASTDDTPEIISKWLLADSRVKSFRNKANLKLPGSLNVGFRNATGVYLTWTSDDNMYRPEAIKEMVSYLENNPDISLVYTDYMQINADGNEFGQIKVNTPDVLPFSNWLGCCFMYRRSVYEKMGDYNEDLFLAEDYDYWLRVAGQFKISPLHMDLYLYRCHAGALTSTRREAIDKATRIAIQKNIDSMYWLSPKDRSEFYLSCAVSERYAADFKAARSNLYRSLYEKPTTILCRECLYLIPALLLGENISNFISSIKSRLRE